LPDWLKIPLARKGMPIMRDNPLFAAQLTTALGLIVLCGMSAPTSAQTAAGAAATKPSGLQCNTAVVTDPFKGKLAGPDIPAGILPVDAATKASVLGSGMPCQERVNPVGLEDVGLENLQRGFDFYSWRTFIAMNSPADGTPIEKSQPDQRTRW
jgi:hypothetical protein